MKYHWLDEMDGLIIEGDILAALEQLDDESIEAIVTDPPYELNFMGKGWDNAGISFRAETWKACLRVLKPGGHMVVFGGTRTHHRMWVAIEDAGFEVRDMLLWMYGQGFPKSLNVGQAIDKAAGAERKVVGPPPYKRGRATQSYSETRRVSYDYPPQPITAPATPESQQWDGWGTALKPACEPILLARKPLSEKTVAANVLKHSTGALNIDATRLAYQSESDKASATPQGRTTARAGRLAGKAQGGGDRREYARPEQKGRWPANVMLQCICDNPQPVPEKARKRSGEESQTRQYDKEGATNFAAEPGIRREGGGFIHESDCPAGMLDAQTGDLKSPKSYTYKGKPETQLGNALGIGLGRGYHQNEYGDSGGASRFFYCPKANKKERGEDNTHPTVKPLALMRWLVRLVTPPNGIVLDPFCGSGSTLIAATEEGFGFIGVDVSPEYCKLAQKRLQGRNT